MVSIGKSATSTDVPAHAPANSATMNLVSCGGATASDILALLAGVLHVGRYTDFDRAGCEEPLRVSLLAQEFHVGRKKRRKLTREQGGKRSVGVLASKRLHVGQSDGGQNLFLLICVCLSQMWTDQHLE